YVSGCLRMYVCTCTYRPVEDAAGVFLRRRGEERQYSSKPRNPTVLNRLMGTRNFCLAPTPSRLINIIRRNLRSRCRRRFSCRRRFRCRHRRRCRCCRSPIRRGVPIEAPIRPQHPGPVVVRPRAQIGVQVPVVLAQPVRDIVPPRLDLGRLVSLGILDPLERRLLVLLVQTLAGGQQPLAGLGVVELVVLALHRLDVLVRPVLLAVEFLGDVLDRDELLHVLDVVGEVHFVGDHWVEPAADDLPD
ncbi:dd02faec-f324-454a-832c-4044bbb1a463, partial [Thermothielavioides terrestris]